MAYILSVVLGFIPLIVTKVLALLGIGLVTYVGADLLLDEATSYLFSQYDNLSTDVVALMNLAGIHEALKMLTATWAGLITLRATQKSANIIMGAK